MLARGLILSLEGASFLDKVTLDPEPNFKREITTSNGFSFNLTVRSFDETYTYFTILLRDQPLCIQTLGRVMHNLVYAPVLTLDKQSHIFFLYSTTVQNAVSYQHFESDVTLCYTTLPYYNEM